MGAQVPVADLAHRAATAIDLLCEDAEGAFVVIEIKTRIISLERHSEEYKRVNTQQSKTVYGVPNSLYYRHQMQVAKTVHMFRKSKLAQGKNVRAFVLVLVDKHVLEYPLAVQWKA